jgi:hypothetical protein
MVNAFVYVVSIIFMFRSFPRYPLDANPLRQPWRVFSQDGFPIDSVAHVTIEQARLQSLHYDSRLVHCSEEYSHYCAKAR